MIATVSERASAPEQRRVGTAVVLATVVTLAAAIPLGLLALDGRDDNATAPSDGLVLSQGSAVTQLAGAVLEEGTDATLLIDAEGIVAASWALYTADGFLLAEGNAVGATPYEIDVPPGTISTLEPGLYDLLVTATSAEGDESPLAARFAIGD